jgi:hypothetical protein
MRSRFDFSAVHPASHQMQALAYAVLTALLRLTEPHLMELKKYGYFRLNIGRVAQRVRSQYALNIIVVDEKGKLREVVDARWCSITV